MRRIDVEGFALSKHPLYSKVEGVAKRCRDPNHHAYHRYSGRGIEFRFPDNEACLRYLLTLTGHDNKGPTLDRIDNDGHYEEGNLRFVDMKDQSRNRSSTKLDLESARAIKDSSESLKILAGRYGVGMSTISAVRNGQNWRDA